MRLPAQSGTFGRGSVCADCQSAPREMANLQTPAESRRKATQKVARSQDWLPHYTILPSRCGLEHYSATVPCTPSTCLAEDAVAISRAIEVAFGVQCQRCAGDSPVRLSREGVQHSLPVSGVHFEHHSVVRSSAIYGSAIEVAGRVADQTCIGERTVRWISCKAVQHSLRVGGRSQLKHHSAAIGTCADTAIVGSSVEIAARVCDETCIGVRPVGCTSGEAVQYSLRAGRIHLEHYSAAVGKAVAAHNAARGSSAVEAACRVPEEPSVGERSIRTALEAVQDCLCAGRVQLEDDSTVRCAASASRAVEVAC